MSPRLFLSMVAALCCVGLFVGCKPMATARMDEEREAYFLDAKEKLFAEDFSEAVVGFEKALEVNPRNAAAHLELGLIHYQHIHDYAAAIYHFRKMLDLRPDHMMAGQIRDHLERCKMDFASSVNLGPLNQHTEARMKRLVEEKDGLLEKVGQMEGQLAQMREVLAVQSQALKSARQKVPSAASPALAGQKAPSGSVANESDAGVASEPSTQVRSLTEEKYRKHVIRSNDNFYKLAQYYGLGLKAIEQANPGIDSTRLQIGQVINIPFPTTTASR